MCTLVSLSINSHHHLVGLAAMSNVNEVNGHSGSDVAPDSKDTVSGKKNQENHVDLVKGGDDVSHKVKASYTHASALSTQKLNSNNHNDPSTGGSDKPVTKPNQVTTTNATNSATVVKPTAATTTQPATNTSLAASQTINATTSPTLGTKVNIPTTPTNLNNSSIADLSQIEAATNDLVNSPSTKSLMMGTDTRRRQLFGQKANPRRRLQQISKVLSAPKKPTVQAITAATIKDILARISSGTKKAVSLYNSTKTRVQNLKSSLGKEQAWVKSNMSSFIKSSQTAMVDVNKMLGDINTAFGQQQGQVNPSTTNDDLGVPLKKGDLNAQDIVKKAKDVQKKLKKFWSIAKIGMAKVQDLRKVIKKMSAFAKGNMKTYLDGMIAKMSLIKFNMPVALAATPAKPVAAPAAKPVVKSKQPAKRLKEYFDRMTKKINKIDFKLPATTPAKVPAKRLLGKLPIKY